MARTKNRYMLIQYIQKAKYPEKTHQKGYWSDPENYQWDEMVEFSFGLKRRDEQKFSVILDLDDQIVVKNGMSQEKSFEALIQYFGEHYMEQIKRYLTQTNKQYMSQSAPTER
jgi:hypothetical protein